VFNEDKIFWIKFKDYKRNRIQENQFYINTETSEIACFRYTGDGFLVRDTSDGQTFQTFGDDTRKYKPVSLQELIDSKPEDTEYHDKLLKLRENQRNNA
jgi:hypothetical protein